MGEVLKSFIDSLIGIIDSGGYPAVFLLSFIDRAAMNLAPAEIILPFFGFLIYEGRFDFWLVIILVTAGGLIGDAFLYWLSAKGGRWFLERFGKYIFISHHELEHTDRLFAKYGNKLVLFGRILPPVRTFIAIPAGIAKMDFSKFALYTVLGSLPWSFALIYLGIKAGGNRDVFKPYLEKIDTFAIIFLVIIAAFYIFRHLRRKHLTH